MRPRFCNSNIDPTKLALIGAFITVIGDFISFLATLAAFQNPDNTENNTKQELRQQIDDMQTQLDNIKQKL